MSKAATFALGAALVAMLAAATAAGPDVERFQGFPLGTEWVVVDGATGKSCRFHEPIQQDADQLRRVIAELMKAGAKEGEAVGIAMDEQGRDCRNMRPF